MNSATSEFVSVRADLDGGHCGRREACWAKRGAWSCARIAVARASSWQRAA